MAEILSSSPAIKHRCFLQLAGDPQIYYVEGFDADGNALIRPAKRGDVDESPHARVGRFRRRFDANSEEESFHERNAQADARQRPRADSVASALIRLTTVWRGGFTGVMETGREKQPKPEIQHRPAHHLKCS